jgi:hypothetical protein
MYRIKVRENGKWRHVEQTFELEDAIECYNEFPVPRMLIGPEGILHKQYSDNGFVYKGKS